MTSPAAKPIHDSRISALMVKPQVSGDVYMLKAKQRGINKTVTITYGKTSLISRSEVRKQATQDLALLHQGIHPRQTKQDDKLRTLTLADAIENMLKLRPLKPQTVQSYRSTLRRNFKAWLGRPIHSITADECLKRYKAIQAEVEMRGRVKVKANRSGECEAQKAIRTLSSIFSFYLSDTLSNGASLLPKGNPVRLIADKKVRPTLVRRKDHLNLSERCKLLRYLQETFNAVNHFQSQSPQFSGAQTDYVMLLLCTGLRRNEPLSLLWENVDFEEGTYTIVNTKNNELLTIPMTERVRKLFRRRLGEQVNDFVFPSPTTPNRAATMSRVIERVAKQSELRFTAHTLRRTVTTILAELRYTDDEIGRLLNHKPRTQTQEYVVVAADQLRPMLAELEESLFEPFTTAIYESD
ncbi:tyrosine-type recombinase/integrase [Litoricolaceae bacterium]|nr:tyrosine-type recombinase/integrase [Litorivicinaceae bacterium]